MGEAGAWRGRSCEGRAAPRPCSWKRGSTQGEHLTFMTRFNQKTLIVNSGEIQGAIFFNPFLIQGSCQLGRGGQLGLRPSSRTSRCAGTAGCSCHGSISLVASEYNFIQENNFYDDSKTNTAIQHFPRQYFNILQYSVISCPLFFCKDIASRGSLSLQSILQAPTPPDPSEENSILL